MKKKKKIMLIDDDKEFAFELKEMLLLGGYDIDTYHDGETALKNVSKFMPDVILLDLKMDKKSGFQVADEVKSSPDIAHIPIIAITGCYTEDGHTLLVKLCGIETRLIKPFNPVDVIAKIESVMK